MHWTGGGSNQLVSYILCLIYLKSLNPNSLSLAVESELTISCSVIGSIIPYIIFHWLRLIIFLPYISSNAIH